MSAPTFVCVPASALALAAAGLTPPAPPLMGADIRFTGRGVELVPKG